MDGGGAAAEADGVEVGLACGKQAWHRPQPSKQDTMPHPAPPTGSVAHPGFQKPRFPSSTMCISSPWKRQEDATSAPVAERPCWSAATATAASAIALVVVPNEPDGPRYKPPVAGIKMASRGAFSTPGANAATVRGNKEWPTSTPRPMPGWQGRPGNGAARRIRPSQLPSPLPRSGNVCCPCWCLPQGISRVTRRIRSSGCICAGRPFHRSGFQAFPFSLQFPPLPNAVEKTHQNGAI